MSKVTKKDLYTLVFEEIAKRTKNGLTLSYSEQADRGSLSTPFATTSDVSTADVINAVKDILEQALPSFILSGLVVGATNPVSDSITITAGLGSIGGTVYELSEDVTIKIPFNRSTTVFFINLYLDRILIEPTTESNKLCIAKVIARNPYLSNILIYNNRSETTRDDAYIQSYQPLKLYKDAKNKLEEDSFDFFKDNIGNILGESIVGTINLSENLNIKNNQNSIFMDSNSLKLYKDTSLLAQLNRNGTFFYNSLGQEVARYTKDDAKIGNILITTNSIQSYNYNEGLSGFKIRDTGDIEVNDIIARGEINASSGIIGGFTILSDKMYGGIIQTHQAVGSGANGVVMDAYGLRGYNATLGLVFNLPTDGSAPTFSSGTIKETIFELSTSSILRTSETVGDGSSSSSGILINNTGIYACENNQLLSSANIKILNNGSAYLRNAYVSGEIYSSVGRIGNVTITSEGLKGGLIEGSTLRGIVIESSAIPPKIRIDENGLYYQVTTSSGKYGESGSGLSGFKYGEGKYGGGLLAKLFDQNKPIFSILQEHEYADLRLYNRGDDSAIVSDIGDIIVKNGILKICNNLGSGNIGNYYSCLLTDGTEGSASVIDGYLQVTIDGKIYKLLYTN